MEPTRLLIAGIVGAAHGLLGEVGIEIRTDRPQAVFVPGATFSSSSGEDLTIEKVRNQGPKLLVRFLGVDDRTAAEQLRGTELRVPPTTEEDAWYTHELQGLAVVDLQGNTLGTVVGIHPLPAQDLLIVDTGDTEVLVPLVEQIVPTVDLGQQTVVVDPPEGLFE